MRKSFVAAKNHVTESLNAKQSKIRPNFQMFDTISVPKELGPREIVTHVLGLHKNKDPFYIVNLSDVVRQFDRWTQNLPNVKPFYAIKSNPDVRILQTLNMLGANFDCASQQEIQEVMAITKDPKRIIYANPVKFPHHLDFAASIGVRRVTADSVNELEKLLVYHKNAEILIRMKPDDSNSICRFSTKFGATVDEAIEMLEFAARNDLKIVGASFHVGSGCLSAMTYADVIKDCAQVFEKGLAIGFKMAVLDIGGGFPGLSGSTGDSFELMSQTIKNSIAEMFVDFGEISVIGEPGRFFSSGSSSLVTSVVGKKTFRLPDNTPAFKYYIDEGVYGGFNCIIFDHSTPALQLLNPKDDGSRYHSVVFGPTCDSMDTIGEMQLPELNVGDKLFVESFGAYTSASSSPFNGFKNSKRYYVVQE